jgi:hypothetical protein
MIAQKTMIGARVCESVIDSAPAYPSRPST